MTNPGATRATRLVFCCPPVDAAAAEPQDTECLLVVSANVGAPAFPRPESAAGLPVLPDARDRASPKVRLNSVDSPVQQRHPSIQRAPCPVNDYAVVV